MHLFRLNSTRRDNFLCLSDENIFASNLRLLLVGVLGSSLSILSLAENVLLFYVFSTSRKLRRQNYVNPVLLSSFDVLVSLIYLLISPVHFVAHRLQSPALIAFWAWNLPILYCLKHFALTVCNLLLVIASLERFLANGPLYSQKCMLVFIVRNKPYVIATILAFAFLLKATLYFEIALVELPSCSNSTDESVVLPVWLANNTWSVYQAARFWVRKFLTVILPFVILAYCNFKIVQQLRKRRRMTLSAEYSEGSVVSQTNVEQLTNKELLSAQNDQNFADGLQNRLSLKTLVVAHRKDEKWNSKVRMTSRDRIRESPTAIVRNIHSERKQKKREHKKNYVRILKGPFGSKKLLTVNDCSKDHPKCSKESKFGKVPNPMTSPNSSFGVRVATRTLVMVVGCYLISNSMSTLLNIWEYFDVKFLRTDNLRIYLVASDVASLLTICGCALRLPIYVFSDKRIRKAICRAIIRFRFCCTNSKPEEIVCGEEAEHFLEKYSIVIVSNSLRSNLTGVLSQYDWGNFQGKRSFDQLAILVQNRRKFLVQMTINLGAVQEMENGERKSTEKMTENGGGQRPKRSRCSLTEIPEQSEMF